MELVGILPNSPWRGPALSGICCLHQLCSHSQLLTSVRLLCVHRMGRELAGGKSLCGIFRTALSVSILPSFMHPSHRAAIPACDFLVQTQLSFAEMPRECSEMGVGDIWGKGWCQESGCCSCNSSNEVPAASCRAACFPPQPSHKLLQCVVRCPAQPFQK